MHHHYNIVHKITSHYMYDDTNDVNFIPIFFNLEERYHLFDTTLGGYDGWRTNDDTLKAVLLEPSKWGNICLMGNPKNEILQSLIGAGVELIEKSAVYSDKIDACIQIAYIAAKADIKNKHIEKATNGLITVQGYIKLQELFYEDFPHKFI